MYPRFFFLLFVAIHALVFSHAQTAARYDVIIDEVFADPSPPVGLPEAEFIELKNRSAHAFDLLGWKITTQSSSVEIKTSFSLKPDSFVVLCNVAAALQYGKFGSTLGIAGFPALNNDAGLIGVESPEKLVVHALYYDKSWYHNAVKSGGGWTLEMIDAGYPCGGAANWTASTAQQGGTPGKKNAVDGIIAAADPPALQRTYTIDSTTVVAVFDHPLDSSASAVADYRFDPDVGNPDSVTLVPPLFNTVRLHLAKPLMTATVYSLTVQPFADCAGHSGSPTTTAKVGLPMAADSSSIIFNELLFNPKPGGDDYIEIYNRSGKVIDLQKLYLTSRDATGGLNDAKKLSPYPLLFFPGDFFVFTEDSIWLQQNYLVRHPENCLQVSALPSLPDDQGNLVLLNGPIQLNHHVS